MSKSWVALIALDFDLDCDQALDLEVLEETADAEMLLVLQLVADEPPNSVRRLAAAAFRCHAYTVKGETKVPVSIDDYPADACEIFRYMPSRIPPYTVRYLPAGPFEVQLKFHSLFVAAFPLQVSRHGFPIERLASDVMQPWPALPSIGLASRRL